jgi:hypothetical protein
MDEELIMSVWDVFLEFIPEKNRDVAATQYVTFLVNHDTNVDALESILGNDEYLDNAIEEVLEEQNSSDDDDYYDEDE